MKQYQNFIERVSSVENISNKLSSKENIIGIWWAIRIKYCSSTILSSTTRQSCICVMSVERRRHPASASLLTSCDAAGGQQQHDCCIATLSKKLIDTFARSSPAQLGAARRGSSNTSHNRPRALCQPVTVALTAAGRASRVLLALLSSSDVI